MAINSRLGERIASGGSSTEGTYEVSALTGRQLLECERRAVTVAAAGDSMDDVVGKLFQRMRTQVFEETGCPVIRLEAQEVWFDEVTCKEREERFLFLFWPRTKRTYRVTARIVVDVDYLKIGKEEDTW